MTKIDNYTVSGGTDHLGKDVDRVTSLDAFIGNFPLGDKLLSERHVQIHRRPPELQFPEPIEKHNATLTHFVKSHTQEVSIDNLPEFVLGLAELYMRRTTDAKSDEMPKEAAAGCTVLSETLRMFEHLYVAKSGGGAV